MTASNVAAYALAPAVGLGLTALAAAHDDRVGEIWVDALLIVEASALAGTLNQVVKFSFGRQRPFAHAGLPNPDPKPGPSDYNLSFYSGHTTFTSSLAAAAGTVATLRGYRWAPVVWFAGGAVAIATGYLRIAADQHYFTDVLTGALLGAGVGVAVPCLFHRAPFNDAGAAADAAAAPRASLAIVPTSGGGALLYAGVW